jgi:adenosylhomocysteinase
MKKLKKTQLVCDICGQAGARPLVDEYVQKDDRRLYVLGEGRLINLVAAEGHPAAMMDMSFATQALATEFVIKNAKKLEAKVYNVPREFENWIATLKLKSMGITIDELTAVQKKYLASWEMGT